MLEDLAFSPTNSANLRAVPSRCDKYRTRYSYNVLTPDESDMVLVSESPKKI